MCGWCHSQSRAKLQAEPKPLEIDLQRTAIVIVDMQNAFVSKGGMLDLMGKLNAALSGKQWKITAEQSVMIIMPLKVQ